ncbi:hypothetical protein BDW59DRAFT_140925 [Aspergillus cavernicola]|uniref:Uncharacterized protein n=1 Tax=Aspergillus cavernicola TaxID=176166 RepID=A0ABR4ISZ8_9EURO
MSFPNHLPANLYQGTIGDITVRWKASAIARLPEDARLAEVDEVALKGVTEHFAHACAFRLGKTGVQIMGSFHNITVDTANGQVSAHACHITVLMVPGQPKAHIYINHSPGMALDHVIVVGESVVLKNAGGIPDPTLSMGTYPAVYR